MTRHPITNEEKRQLEKFMVRVISEITADEEMMLFCEALDILDEADLYRRRIEMRREDALARLRPWIARWR